VVRAQVSRSGVWGLGFTVRDVGNSFQGLRGIRFRI